MKKMILIFVMLNAFLFVKAQDSTKTAESNSAITINRCKDVMTDKEYVFVSESLLCSDDGKKGFSVHVNLSFKNEKIVYGGVTTVSAGIGGCLENCTLIFLFDDDSKLSMTSWNDFNCKGNSYFDLYRKQFGDLSIKKVKAIRFTNGRTYDSYTYTLKSQEMSYFIDVAKLLEKQEYITTKCD